MALLQPLLNKWHSFIEGNALHEYFSAHLSSLWNLREREIQAWRSDADLADGKRSIPRVSEAADDGHEAAGERPDRGTTEAGGGPEERGSTARGTREAGPRPGRETK